MSSVSLELAAGLHSEAQDAGVASDNAEHDLSRLMLDMAMAELDMALETVSTMIFELQVSSAALQTLVPV